MHVFSSVQPVCVFSLVHLSNLRSFWWLRWQKIHVQCRRPGFDPWVEKIPWRRPWKSSPGFLPGKSHGQRSLVGYGPWGHKESDMTEATKHSTAHRYTSGHRINFYFYFLLIVPPLSMNSFSKHQTPTVYQALS